MRLRHVIVLPSVLLLAQLFLLNEEQPAQTRNDLEAATT